MGRKPTPGKGTLCSCGKALIIVKGKCRHCYYQGYEWKRRGVKTGVKTDNLCSCGKYLIAVKGKCLHCYQKEQQHSRHIREKKAFEEAKSIKRELTNFHLQQLSPEKFIKELEKRGQK